MRIFVRVFFSWVFSVETTKNENAVSLSGGFE